MAFCFSKFVVFAAISFAVIQVQADTKTEEEPGVKVDLEHYFTELYAKTCLENAANMSLLKDRFLQAEVSVLQKDKAAFFLGKQQGTVWIIPHVVGDFLVSIDQRNHCTVYTRNININLVESYFTGLLESSAQSHKIERIQDETLADKQGPTHYISYSRINRKDYSKQKFKLITSMAQGAKIQAKAIVEEVRR